MYTFLFSPIHATFPTNIIRKTRAEHTNTHILLQEADLYDAGEDRTLSDRSFAGFGQHRDVRQVSVIRRSSLCTERMVCGNQICCFPCNSGEWGTDIAVTAGGQ